MKPFKNIISAYSTPTQLKVPFTGLTKALKIAHKGFIKNIFSELAGPKIKMLHPLSRLFKNIFITANGNSSIHKLLH